MEIYVTNEQGQTTTVYQFDPASVNNTVWSLFPIWGNQSVNVTCAGVTSESGTCRTK